MEQIEVPQQKPRIDWLNHALEFFVVVIGILLAFQLDKYAESRQQQKTLDAHRTGILEETRLNQKTLQYALDLAQTNAEKITELMGLIEADDGDPTLINQMALELIQVDYAYIKKNAYSTLTQSGDIRWMSFEEKSEIIDLYEYYGWVESIQRQNLATHQDHYIALVQTHLDLHGKIIQPIEFYRSKIFVNAVLTYQFGLGYKISKYQDCLELVKAFIAAKSINQAVAE